MTILHSAVQMRPQPLRLVQGLAAGNAPARSRSSMLAMGSLGASSAGFAVVLLYCTKW